MEDITQENSDSIERESALADDAVPVCPNCLEPCNPLDNYCPNCGSNEAINPLVPYLPFEGIRFAAGVYAKLWKQMWGPGVSTGLRILQIGLFVLFFPFIFLIGLPFVIMEKRNSRNSTSTQQDIE